MRHDRQDQLISPEGTARLRRATVLVVGVGGLGSPVVLYLAAAGVGTLRLADDDRVELSNLGRQVLFGTADLGRPKAAAAHDRVARLDPAVGVEVHPSLTAANAHVLVTGCDAVLGCTDTMASRYLLDDAAAAAGVPHVYGAIRGWEGQVGVLGPGGPRLRELLPPGDEPEPAGVVGPVAGVVGSWQAALAIRVLLGHAVPDLALVDVARGTSEVLSLG